MRALLAAVLAALIATPALAPSPALAQADLFSPDAFDGVADLRLAAADGEAAWTDYGYGKARYGGAADGGFKLHPELAEAALVWKPRFTWSLSGHLHLQHQPEQENDVDVNEAYLSWKPAPRTAWRYGARLGLFYPPISQEHDDAAWGVTNTITPSAINSWVGEEVKVIGLELKASRSLGNGAELGAAVAVFDHNDTSGTLVSLRGWGLDDVQSTAYGGQPLPTLLPRYRGIWRGQAPTTIPVLELDNRLGAYLRVDWRTGGKANFNAFYYDNAGNRTAVTNGQWSWDTRFWNLGATYDLDGKTRFLGQVMDGETLEGFRTARGLWIDVGFTSAYVMAVRDIGKGALSLRGEMFETRDRSFQDRDDNDERGWALTGAWRYDVTPFATLKLEAMHVGSNRAGRIYAGLRPRQDQTVLQSALRLHF
jgi:hypothetical protein